MSVSVKETDWAYIFTGNCSFLTEQDAFQLVSKEDNLLLSSKPPGWILGDVSDFTALKWKCHKTQKLESVRISRIFQLFHCAALRNRHAAKCSAHPNLNTWSPALCPMRDYACSSLPAPPGLRDFHTHACFILPQSKGQCLPRMALCHDHSCTLDKSFLVLCFLRGLHY